MMNYKLILGNDRPSAQTYFAQKAVENVEKVTNNMNRLEPEWITVSLILFLKAHRYFNILFLMFLFAFIFQTETFLRERHTDKDSNLRRSPLIYCFNFKRFHAADLVTCWKKAK